MSKKISIAKVTTLPKPSFNRQMKRDAGAQNRKRTLKVRADSSTRSTVQLPVKNGFNKKIGVIGAGAWGTALGIAAHRAGNDVLLWAREVTVVDQINAEHTNLFLPDVILPTEIKATGDLKQLIDFADIVLITTPAQFTRAQLEQIKPYWKNETPIVLCAKGIEVNTGELMSEIVADVLPHARICVLSGPGFAVEVAHQKPTAITIAAQEKQLAVDLVKILGSTYFRPYSSGDILTPQICGALKNVIAIASGIVEGYNLGDNARAALIARGLFEMTMFARAMGGHMRSALGLSGVGDLVLTASSKQSRNYALGMEIGRAGSAKSILSSSTKTVEGVPTTRAVMKRARKLGLEMPICSAMERLLFNNAKLDDCINDLLFRPFKSEDMEV